MPDALRLHLLQPGDRRFDAPAPADSEQRAINDALDDAALTQNYSLKYPKSGDHRSAFVFHDIDGDGEEEAIVFYEPSIDNTARIVLLDRQDGVWRSLCDLPGAGQDVEFVAFANITAKDASDVVVGWSGSDREEKQLRVYRYSPADRVLVNALAEGVSPGYTTYLIDDLDRNGPGRRLPALEQFAHHAGILLDQPALL